MFNIIKNGDNTQSNVVEIVADLVSDIATLPTTYGIGSDCICLENSSVWMLGNDPLNDGEKKWVEL